MPRSRTAAPPGHRVAYGDLLYFHFNQIGRFPRFFQGINGKFLFKNPERAAADAPPAPTPRSHFRPARRRAAQTENDE